MLKPISSQCKDPQVCAGEHPLRFTCIRLCSVAPRPMLWWTQTSYYPTMRTFRFFIERGVLIVMGILASNSIRNVVHWWPYHQYNAIDGDWSHWIYPTPLSSHKNGSIIGTIVSSEHRSTGSTVIGISSHSYAKADLSYYGSFLGP